MLRNFCKILAVKSEEILRTEVKFFGLFVIAIFKLYELLYSKHFELRKVIALKTTIFCFYIPKGRKVMNLDCGVNIRCKLQEQNNEKISGSN